MKKILIFSVLYILFVIYSGGLRSAEQYGSQTTYSMPSYIVRYLNSPNSLEEPAVSCHEDSEQTQPINCTKTSSFWQRLRFYGWLECGFYLNSDGSKNQHFSTISRDGHNENYQTPNSGNSSLLGNVKSANPILNQFWIGLKRDVNTQHGFDWGFKTDFLFGMDAWLSQSYGDASFDYRGHARDYYVSLPQIYGVLGYKNLSVKIGKFETLLGVEQFEAAKSTFYSHSNLFYTEPQTHSGVLAEYRCKPNLWLDFGYVQGADNSFRNDFDDHGFLGGIYWRPISSISVWYTVYAANLGNGRYKNSEYHQGGTIFQHTFAVNWMISPRWHYTFQWNIGDRNGGHTAADATYFGTAHYLTFQAYQHLKIGLRFDQIHASQGMNDAGFSRPFTGNYTGDLYGVTLGVNWSPYRRLNIRPELRYDFAQNSRPFNYGKKREQFSAGCGFVYLF
ncbi:MAG: porin [Planctomycetaceae bacterium]|nr:porin [Planctomycetaceae bacterium]